MHVKIVVICDREGGREEGGRTYLGGSSTGVRLDDTPMRRWRLLLTSVYSEEEVLLRSRVNH